METIARARINDKTIARINDSVKMNEFRHVSSQLIGLHMASNF